MITAFKEKEFLASLYELPFNNKKLILGYAYGNNIRPEFEIRYMATAGGGQYGLAEIYLNMRGSGRYTTDVEEVYLFAYEEEKRRNKLTLMQWFLVEDSEHTINSSY